jgi:hypothetical protein
MKSKSTIAISELQNYLLNPKNFKPAIVYIFLITYARLLKMVRALPIHIARKESRRAFRLPHGKSPN